jgi:hypothetical protein
MNKKEVTNMADLKDLNIKDVVEKAEGAVKKAGLSEKDIDKAKDKVVDVAKDIIEKKTGKKD